MRDHRYGPRSGPPWARPRSSGGGPPWGRPPWWPEGESFPPAGPGGWDWRRRRRFMRRVGLLFLLFFLLTSVASGVFVRWLGGGFGHGGPRGGGFWLPLPLLGLAVLVIMVAAGRALRATAAPIGDVMEAADRVAGGDYGARVEARGPGEARRGPVLEETAVMARLLDDLQTLSTAEAGVLRLHRERVDPASLAEDAVAAFRARAGTAGVTLDWRAAPGLPELDVDPVRVGEVLANLLSNAVRHTPRGGSVVVAVEPAAAGVAFTVSDTGSGIASQDLPQVFNRFVKSADSGGVGLGLAIARSLVEAHGGEITAESEPGRGTTMRFVLPTSPPR